VVRDRRVIEIRALTAILGALLLAGAMVGCGGDVGEGNAGGRGGGRGSAVATGETMALEEDRPASGAARGGAGLDVEVVSTGGDYAPVGYGEGSLWATEPSTCNDTMSASGSASSSGGASFPSTILMEASAQAMCAPPDKMLLKRLNPRTGEEEATITLEGFFAETPDVAVGAGSLWVSSADGAADAVLRVDPEAGRVVDRIPVPAESATSLAFGHGSVWIASSGRDTVSRVDPRTGEVAAEIEVGRGAVDVAAGGGSGDVWVAGAYLAEAKKLSRVDPETDRVVAEVPVAAHKRYGGAQGVAAGEGAVWAQSADGGELFKVDPATNEVVAEKDLGDYSSDLAVYGGSVWAVAQVSVGTRLYRIDPQTVRVVASEHGPDPSEGGFGGLYGELVAGGGFVWFQSENRLSRVSP
jgi:streptogramin lyase